MKSKKRRRKDKKKRSKRMKMVLNCKISPGTPTTLFGSSIPSSMNSRRIRHMNHSTSISNRLQILDLFLDRN